MSKEQVLADISSLIHDIDKCTENLLDGRYSHNEEKFHAFELQMERLMVAAHQELSFLHDYIKEGAIDVVDFVKEHSDELLKIANKQKPAEWSEEDEKILKSIIADMESLKRCRSNHLEGYFKECIEWLKSLKERVQPQPKQDWSEEDEKMYSAILRDVRNGEPLDKLQYDWLNSIRPQNKWKPSDEQMEALDDFIYAKYPNIEKYGAAVKSLYQYLKKLKE